ncbi:unnamed protein product, partial [Arabidopsis lyrata]
MANRRRGKEIMVDATPSELPEDLPDGCSYNMSWRNPKNKKTVLLPIIDQGRVGYCWTIVFSMVVASHLYIHQKVGVLLNLSAKHHLFANIEEKFSNGFLKSYNGVKIFLKENGMVLERECKCNVGKYKISKSACDKVKDKMAFKIRDFIVVEEKIDEKQIIRLLQTRGPIAAHIRVSKQDEGSRKDEIYYGPKNSNTDAENHIVLITGIGTRNGVHYFEYQGTWGTTWGGDNGFGKF